MSKRWGLLGIVVIFLLVALTGNAAESPDQETVEMEPVVVSATGTEVPVKDSTQSVTVITEKEIQERQAIRVEEMLRYVPGITLNQSGSRGGETSLFLRGGNSNQTQVLFNGIRLNDAGGDFDFGALTTDNLRSIEVVRGPMSALYGADAMVGVINLRTKQGVGPPTLTLSSGWGPRSENSKFIGEQRGSFIGSYKKFGYSVGFSRIDDPGILPNNNLFYSNNLTGRLDLEPLDNLSITHHTLLLDIRFGVSTETSGDIFDPKGRGGPGLDPTQKQRRSIVLQGLTVNYWPFTWWENELTVAYVQRERNFNDPWNPFESDFDLSFGSFQSRDFERRFSADYHSNLRFGSRDKVESISTVGVTHRNEQLKQWLWSGAVPPFVGPSASFLKTSRNATSFYAQEQLNLWNRVFLVGGFRVENNSVFSQAEFIPRASAAIRIPETNTTIRAAGGRAIKEPTFLETFSRSQLSEANPDLKPEVNVSWEVGLDQYLWDNRVKFSGTYFENNFKGLITFVPRVFPVLSSFENIGQVRVNGLELSARVKPLTGLTLGLVYTNLMYFKVTDDGGVDSLFFKTGLPLLRRPRHTFSFVVDYVYDRLNLNLSGVYIGSRDDSLFTFTLPFTFAAFRVNNSDAFIMNLAGSYDLVRDWGYANKVQLWFRLNNLLNRNYQEAFGFSSPGFFMVGGLRVVFGKKQQPGQKNRVSQAHPKVKGIFSPGFSRIFQEANSI